MVLSTWISWFEADFRQGLSAGQVCVLYYHLVNDWSTKLGPEPVSNAEMRGGKEVWFIPTLRQTL